MKLVSIKFNMKSSNKAIIVPNACNFVSQIVRQSSLNCWHQSSYSLLWPGSVMTYHDALCKWKINHH